MGGGYFEKCLDYETPYESNSPINIDKRKNRVVAMVYPMKKQSIIKKTIRQI